MTLTNLFFAGCTMPLEFIQIPANGQGSAKEELNKLLRGGRIASVRKAFVPNGEDSFWAFPHQSQRDCVSKPRVGTLCLPWVTHAELSTPPGLRHRGGIAGTDTTHPQVDTTPVGLDGTRGRIPKVASCRRNLGLWDAILSGLEVTIRSAAIGLEPGEPGRQLEQQRQQLSCRESQQQQPGQLRLFNSWHQLLTNQLATQNIQ